MKRAIKNVKREKHQKLIKIFMHTYTRTGNYLKVKTETDFF